MRIIAFITNALTVRDILAHLGDAQPPRLPVGPVAGNGEEALKQVDECKPDLVLLDVMMPVRSGYEVSKRIRERADWRHIKIIMLSAKGRDAEVNKGLSIGAIVFGWIGDMV